MFEPCDEGYEEKVRDSFNRQEVMKTVKASILVVRPGEVELAFPFEKHRYINAGIISTVLDSACGYAAFSLMPADVTALTIEFKITLLSPAKGECFKAIGKVVKPGTNITITQGELFTYIENRQKLVATMTGTVMSVYNKGGVIN